MPQHLRDLNEMDSKKIKRAGKSRTLGPVHSEDLK